MCALQTFCWQEAELLEEELEQEQVPGLRHRNANGQCPELTEEVQGLENVGQSESEESAGQGLGEGQQVEIVRKFACTLILILS